MFMICPDEEKEDDHIKSVENLVFIHDDGNDQGWDRPHKTSHDTEFHYFFFFSWGDFYLFCFFPPSGVLFNLEIIFDPNIKG